MNKSWSPSLKSIFIKKKSERFHKISTLKNDFENQKVFHRIIFSFLSGPSQELMSLMLWKFELKWVAILFLFSYSESYTTAKNQWGKATRQLWISFGSIQKKQKPGGHLWNANSRKAELEIMRFDNNHCRLFCRSTLGWKIHIFQK